MLRTREIGIRMAVGARDRDAAALVVRQALLSAALGIAIGLPCSVALAHAFRAMLFGVSAWNGAAFMAASAVPAVRAARVNPLDALRVE
jgi:ABC-type antimicrobial peptide transport system permease subunit